MRLDKAEELMKEITGHEQGIRRERDVKGKSLCLTKHHAMRTYWGSEGIAPRILHLGTRYR